MRKNSILYSAIFILILFLISFTVSVTAAQTAYITCDDGNVYLINTASDTVISNISTSPTGSENHLASFRFQNTFLLNV